MSLSKQHMQSFVCTFVSSGVQGHSTHSQQNCLIIGSRLKSERAKLVHWYCICKNLILFIYHQYASTDWVHVTNTGVS